MIATELRRAWLVVLALGLGAPLPALAQGRPADVALAEALFVQAKDAMSELRFDDACPKFQESHRLDPKLGTLLNLALCHEQQGKVATAWGEFTDAARESKRVGQQSRESFALDHVRALEPRLSFVRVTSLETTVSSWTLDGRKFSPAAFGSRLPVDPGAHNLEVDAPNRPRWTKLFEVGKDPSVVEIVIPMLPGATATPKPEVASAPAVEPASASRTTALVSTGAVALVGIGIGTAFGFTAISKHTRGNERCEGTVCRGDGASLQDQARTAGWISTAGFGVGLLASGAFLYFALRAPSPSGAAASARAPALQVVPSLESGRGAAAGSVDVRGTF